MATICLSYVEAILRVYNQYGRRDNIYKARIKILVHELGAEKFAQEVEDEWRQMDGSALTLDDAAIEEIRSRFSYPAYEKLRAHAGRVEEGRARSAIRGMAQEFGVRRTRRPATRSSRCR